MDNHEAPILQLDWSKYKNNEPLLQSLPMTLLFKGQCLAQLGTLAPCSGTHSEQPCPCPFLSVHESFGINLSKAEAAFYPWAL